MVKDLVDGSKYDLMIAGVAALCLIFIIMLIMTRSFIAALVIVGTVLLSLGASFGLSVLVWQDIARHTNTLGSARDVGDRPFGGGSDYNLLLVSRMKEEIGAGINTGIIRAMGGTGKVVTNAGLVFAFTMAVHGGQRSAHHRSGGHDDRAGSAVRHVGRARVHDAVHRRAAGTLVLVAATSAPPPRQCITSAVRTPSVGTCLVAETAAVSGGFPVQDGAGDRGDHRGAGR